MSKIAANNTEQTTENGTSGACARFEPIKSILIRCDQKTVERAPTMSALAA